MKIQCLVAAVVIAFMVGSAEAQAAAPGCGRISQFDVTPRGRQVYPVRVLEIDGEVPGPAASDVYRIAPGPHVVRVAELIDSEEFTGVELRRRSMNRDSARADITFEVEAGYTYFVGAQSFLRQDRDAIAVQRGREYWAPVVYQRIAENCR